MTTTSLSTGSSDRSDPHEWATRIARYGWAAKGAVYVLIGAAAVSIATASGRADEEASPKGALRLIEEQPTGRVLLAVLSVGLGLYTLWRAMSVWHTEGGDVSGWLDRLGYALSAVTYAGLTYTAATAVLRDHGPETSSTIEQLSRRALEVPGGRIAVGVAGMVVLAVGAWFALAKGIGRRFTDDLHDLSPRPDATDRRALVLLGCGVIGWVGRGVVTTLIGMFLLSAAIGFDPGDARGFDRTLDAMTTSGPGRILAWFAAVGLLGYGVFAIVSASERRLEAR